jgi:site-specific recombinase XerD
MIAMGTEQRTIFDARPLRGQLPPAMPTVPPTAEQTVAQTLPAYYDYLSSTPLRGKKPSKHTPSQYRADMELFGGHTQNRPLYVLQTTDLRQWIGTLPATMAPKTVSRKVSALVNYFEWLATTGVLQVNPAAPIHAKRVTAPASNLLYESECEELLRANSTDPRGYLVILLLIETGMKRAELLELEVADFDFSDEYEPVVLVKHSDGQTRKDRKNKLPRKVKSVLEDYVQRYHVSGRLFPYATRYFTSILNDAAMRAKITKPVTTTILRDICVIHGVRRGEKLEAMFEKIGLAKDSYDDARKKYERLLKEPV